ncbi:MAG: OmpA family protein [Treponema sp.]|jgi:outer membrane protein OmpA-like peptidoglycan-associated protein|nr:OmpA family protein [Treponema sp.]
MKRNVLFLVMLFVFTSGALVPCIFAQNGKSMAFGIGSEYNMNSQEDIAAAAGVSLVFDYNLASAFAAGLNLGLSFSEITTLEPEAMFRWYFLSKEHSGFFAQADAGLAVVDAEAMFLGGLRAGYRLPFKDNYYVEPYGRIGYPFMMGGGIVGGISFPLTKAPPPPPPPVVEKPAPPPPPPPQEVDFSHIVEIVEQEHDDRIMFEFDSEGRLHLGVTIVFRADAADFDGLSRDILTSNGETFAHVADILNRFKEFKVIIEGHANPTTPPGPQREREEPELKEMSEQRALKVVDELRRLGVELDRKSVHGAGGSRLLAPYDDRENNWKNRRVEFIITNK